jgi:AbrB family looped-hinge helix DNA binding protein
MSRMTSKGQVTIPKKIRDYLGLKPGSEVEFVVTNDGQIALGSKAKPPKGRFDDLVGSAGPGMTTDEVMKLTRGWGEADYDVK